ncbi:hypothetical protein OE903_04055 [Bacillus sp. B6(2022)]|nr:hypothetical protein [Bacillus sp. B6(2022)]
MHFEANTLCTTVDRLRATLHQSEDEKEAEKKNIKTSYEAILEKMQDVKRSKLVTESVKKTCMNSSIILYSGFHYLRMIY